jgi:hypothetical protein
MKKLLGVALTAASIGLAASPAEAATPSTPASAATSVAAPQWGRYSRRGYVTAQSRFVRVGGRVYREVYQVRHLPNGRSRARLVSRLRVR